MLQSAAMPIDDMVDGPSDIALPVPFPAAPLPQNEAGRYGQRSHPNVPAIGLIILLHVVAIAALVQVRDAVVRAQPQKLTVVNLSPPPPPPATETPPPPPSAPQVVAPPPIVRTPAPPVLIQTSPEPVPVIAVNQPAPPSPAPVTHSAPPMPPSILQGGDLSTQMMSGKPPRYPVESRRKREQGTVVLTLTLGLDGGVETILVSQSSGFRRLDDAARDAVKGWRWKPMMQGGQPMRVRGVVEIPFVLRTDA